MAWAKGMKLHSRHVALLTPLEQKVYRPLLGSLDFAQEKRDLYISQSYKYQEGDENVLPFPERSKRGIMLLSLCRQLYAPETKAAVIFEPKAPHNTLHVKRKLLALGTQYAYAVPPSTFLAAAYSRGKSPFAMWRNGKKIALPGVPYASTPNLICALNPPAECVIDSTEYGVLGILLNPGKDEKPSDLPLFTEAAKLGLLEVTEKFGRVWLSK